MKTKITFYVLMIVFILSAAHCSKDKLLDDILSRPGAPGLNPPPLVPDETGSGSDSSQFHIYTDIEREQVRQNLVGRYRGVLNNQEAILDIRASDVVYITIEDRTRTVSRYTINFANDEPGLIFEVNNRMYGFDIQFTRNSYTEVIELKADTRENRISYFHKLENNESQHHDEL